MPEKYEKGCVNMFDCNKCHGQVEYNFHPNNYKMFQCMYGNQCNNPNCHLYHNQDDMRTPYDAFFINLPRNRRGSFGKINPH